ncbi:MAG: hypothetical protein RMJ60_03455 [Anaerolineales bacterium]|nr:hypothetical protein [Anaerolineales bacterium]
MTTFPLFRTKSIDRDILFDRIRKLFFYAILISWGALSLAPLYFTLVFSLKPIENAYTPPIWWPIPFTLENYQTILQTFDLFPRWVFNSVYISVLVTIFRVLFCAMAGYAFARIAFPLKNLPVQFAPDFYDDARRGDAHPVFYHRPRLDPWWSPLGAI